MNKLVRLVLSLVMIIGIAGCEKSETVETGEKATPEVVAKEEVKEVKEPKKEELKADMPVIEETVLVEKDGYKITALGIVNGTHSEYGVEFLLENNSENDVTFTLARVVVNDYTSYTGITESVKAGESAKAIGNIDLGAVEFEVKQDIAKIKMQFMISNYADDTYKYTDYSEVHTQYYENYKPVTLEGGSKVVEFNGVKIMAGVMDENEPLGQGLRLYVENMSDSELEVQFLEMMVNGYPMRTATSTTVGPGEYGLSYETFYGDDLKNTGIEEIETIEFIVQFYEKNMGMVVYASEWTGVFANNVDMIGEGFLPHHDGVRVHEDSVFKRLLTVEKGVQIGYTHSLDNGDNAGLYMHITNENDFDIIVTTNIFEVNGAEGPWGYQAEVEVMHYGRMFMGEKFAEDALTEFGMSFNVKRSDTMEDLFNTEKFSIKTWEYDYHRE